MSRPIPVPSLPPAWLIWSLRLVALVLAALHTIVAMRSQSMNEDGIAYLDLGDALWQGRWEDVANTTWSPLYAAAVGGAVNFVGPSLSFEFPLVHLVNLAIFAIALLSFEFFWRALSVSYYGDGKGADGSARFPPALWAAIGYSLFTYTALNLISVWAVTPDMCVAVVVFLAAGTLLRLERDGARVGFPIGLGLLLGVGYLAKAVMFPLGLVLIALTVLLPAREMGRPRRLAWSLAAFLLVAVPWASVVSGAAGHPTFSDVGRFTYLKHVNGMPWPDWQTAVEQVAGTPLHAPRRIHDDPAVWEFAAPIGGTYPLGYDPAWWTQGLEPTFEPGDQLGALAANLIIYFDLFVRMQGGLLAVTALLVVTSFWRTRRRIGLDGTSLLVMWALAAFGLYSLVFAESRYLAPFILLFWAGLLSKIRLQGGETPERTLMVGGSLLVLFTWLNVGALNLEGLAGQVGIQSQRGALATARPSARRLSGGPRATAPQVAAALREAGLEKGSPIAFAGYSYSAFWARLARVRIVAEVRPRDLQAFWQTDHTERERVLSAISSAGAVALITEPVADRPVLDGFEVLSDTGYLLRRLR